MAARTAPTAAGVGIVILCAGVTACNDGPDPVTPEAVIVPQFVDVPGTEALRDVAERTIDVPREPRPWDLSAAALETALADGGWHATVAFKAPGSERLAADLSGKGVRQAVTKATVEAGLRLLELHGVEVVRYHAPIAAAHAIFPPDVSADIWGHDLIEYIEPQHVVYRSGSSTVRPTPVPTPGSTQTIPIGARAVRADWVWDTYNGSGIRVGIIDDGYERSHPDLYSISTSHCETWTASSCFDGWHGTFVAGVLVAEDNNEGVVGIAPGVESNFWWCRASGNINLANCVSWMMQSPQNVRVINMSLGAPQFAQDVADMVEAAYSNPYRRLLVAIADNRDSVTTPNPPSAVYPASYTDYVIGVSGVMPSDSAFASGPGVTGGDCTQVAGDSIFAGWGNASNFGSYVELSGPFYTLSTAVADPSQEPPQPYEYGAVCGTSFAAPHVSGVAALIWDKYGAWTNVQVRNHLQATAHDLGTGGRDDRFGHGLVDACEALGLLPVCEPQPPSVYISGPVWINNAGSYTWQANASGGSGSYSYSWEFRPDGGSWFFVSSQPSYQTYVSHFDDPGFDLRVTVTSGGNQASDTHSVLVQIGGECEPFCQ